MERNRVPIIVTTAVLVVAGLPLLYWLRFDFNPVNLRSPKVELVATYLELSREPESNTNTIGVLAPSLKEADAVGARLFEGAGSLARHDAVELRAGRAEREAAADPHRAEKSLDRALDPKEAADPPTDAENVEAFNETATQLNKFAASQPGQGADASRRLATALSTIAKGDQALRKRVEAGRSCRR